MKIAIILEAAAGLELDRKEVDVPDGDKGAISAAVDNAVASWRTVCLGDTLRIRAIDERPAPDYDQRSERVFVESAVTIGSSSDVPLQERTRRLIDLWDRLVQIARPGRWHREPHAGDRAPRLSVWAASCDARGAAKD